MFEKDAEERYKQHLADPNYYENSEEESYLRGFVEGAEFGYNKANEWHYVKDGDLPKERCIVYYKDSIGVPSWSVVNPTWYIAGVEAFFKNNSQIIAWKEIVLPELPKESE